MLPLVMLAMLSGCLKSPSEPAIQEPATITLSSYSIVLTSIGQRVLINATVLDQDSRVIADATIFFRSSNEKIATVGNSGLVTAVAMGSTQITVSSGYATASATVTVMQEAGSIEISPPSATLTMPGETVQMTAEVKDSGNTTIPGAAVVWSSSHPQYATVDANGLVTAVSNGTTQITATSGGVSTSRPVFVVLAQPAARIELNISEATLTSVGQSLQLDALVYDIDGVAIPGAMVTWSSSHSAVATVSDNGLVSAVSNGTTLVTATSGGVSTFATIHVVIEGTVPPPPPPPPVTSTDRDVLIAFYNATDGPHWTNNTNWLTDGPIGTWYGVEVNESGRVTVLSLYQNNLNGTIPREVGQLQLLETLNLSANPLSGGIPSEIEELVNLVDLWLSGTRLTGAIPPGLGNLSALRYLGLDNNRLTGGIPGGLGSLSALRFLSLSENQLTGGIPSEIGKLENLQALLVHGNQLTGGIPSEIGNLSALRDLYLNDNLFSGGIQPEIGQLQALDKLHLHNNQNLSGPLPTQITAISSVRYISLEGTQLCVPTDAVFQAWLDGIEMKSGVMFCEALSSDRDALIAFYNATGGPNWTNRTKWLTDAPLGEWFGVTTDDDGRVTELNLDTNNLTGVIPPDIGRVQNLRVLYLGGNQLTGSIPPEIGQLNDLRDLSLRYNQLTGKIPAEILQLRSLVRLALGPNQLSGEIPSEIGHLASLESLELDGNQFEGAIPPEIGNLSALRRLILTRNRITGSIPPGIANLTALEDLVFNSNQLEGEIPPGIGNLSALRTLDFTNNRLTGEIPPGIGNLTALEALWLGQNQLTGVIPTGIGNLIVIEHLSLHTNRISGELPLEIGRLVALTKLDLHDNQLSGGISPEFGNLKKLEQLQLQNNKNMAGPLPIELTTITMLRLLSLSGTQLCVPDDSAFRAWLDSIESKSVIPLCEDEPEDTSDRDALEALYNTTDGPNWTINTNWKSEEPLGEWYGVQTDSDGRVTALQLDENGLAGTLPPKLGELDRLEVMNLGTNDLIGTIPPELGDLVNLSVLHLSINQLTGAIPVEITRLRNLRELYITENKLTGTIPPEIGQLDEIRHISLVGNELSDSIPLELGDLSNLTHLELGQNRFNGQIPRELGQLEKLEWLDLLENNLTGSIPKELSGLKNVMTVQLQLNQLSGSIPPELGKLNNLTNLNLGNNELSGPIPPELGDLTSLESLGLEFNQLMGPVPPEFGKLTELTGLRLQNNLSLSGPLPLELIEVPLTHLSVASTNLCAPVVEAFQTWLASIPNKSDITECAPPPPPPPKPVADSININPDSVTLTLVDATAQLTATVYDANGEVIVDAAVTWSSSASSVARVNTDGLVTAVADGTTMITARSDTASASIQVTVMTSNPDRDVLVELYNATDGPNWTNRDKLAERRSYRGTWYGVNTDGDGRVVELRLYPEQPDR